MHRQKFLSEEGILDLEHPALQQILRKCSVHRSEKRSNSHAQANCEMHYKKDAPSGSP